MKSKEDLRELRMKSEKDLILILKKENDKLREKRFKAKFRDLKDVKEIKKTRRYIARILTILSERLQKQGESK